MRGLTETTMHPISILLLIGKARMVKFDDKILFVLLMVTVMFRSCFAVSFKGSCAIVHIKLSPIPLQLNSTVV